MPLKYYKKALLENDSNVDTVIFGYDMDKSGREKAVIGRVKTDKAFEGAAGASSGVLNEMNTKLQNRQKSKVYNMQAAVVDEILYGIDLDPQNLSDDDIRNYNI